MSTQSQDLASQSSRPSVESSSVYIEYIKRGRAAQTRKTAFRARLRQEQAEARALGVAVVEKVTLDNRWTDEERDVLRTLYPDYGMIQKKLPGRSLWAIRTQCRDIGLHKKRDGHAFWTPSAIKRLRELYPIATTAELRAAFPSISPDQIRNRASYLKLHRPKKGLRSTGNPLCDAIRERAKALNLTMLDLDMMASTNRYFSHGDWRKQEHSYAKMVKGILALGGTVTVDWGEND